MISDESFESVVKSLSNIQTKNPVTLSYINNVKILSEKTVCFSFLKQAYDEHDEIKFAFQNFAKGFRKILKNEIELKKEGKSIELMKHYLLQYITFKIKDENSFDSTVKKMAEEIMGDYNILLFVCKVLDNDTILYEFLKVGIRNLSSSFKNNTVFPYLGK